jgi:hypothetical protein
VFVVGLSLAMFALVSAAASGPGIDSIANDKTALMTAARQGDTGAVARLIASGADVNARNANGGTALMYAALGGDPAVAVLLVDAGARPRSY